MFRRLYLPFGEWIQGEGELKIKFITLLGKKLYGLFV
jgi:hypothetical protein